jgi:hypothetical protein
MAEPSEQPPLTAAEARAQVEARRGAERAAREGVFRDRYGDTAPGRPVIAVSWVSTAFLVLATVAAVVDPDAFDTAYLAVAFVYFLAGSALFAVDVVLAALRSRESSMGIGGLFFLAGSAPRSVQWHLLGSLVVQIVVVLVGAGIGFARIDDRQLNSLAFGTLAPVLALGCCGLWGVRHGLFPDRDDPAVADGR